MNKLEHSETAGRGPVIPSIIGIIATVAIVVGSASLFLFLVQKYNTAKTPDIQPPITNEGQVTQTEPKKVQLLTSPYTPSEDVYSNSAAYANQSIKVALKGDFDKFFIKASGKLTKDDVHFFSINVGNDSGVINAVRNSNNGLDIAASRSLGGVFDGIGNFAFQVDFKSSTTLSTTGSEYSQIHQGTKSLILWDSILPPPPTVFRFLLAPFGKDGKYGGASIESVELNYTCAKNSDCGVYLCNPGDTFTLCLKEKINYSAAKSWCDRTKAPNCENLKP